LRNSWGTTWGDKGVAYASKAYINAGTAKIGSGEIVLKHFPHWEGAASVNHRFRVVIRVHA
jgi:C1A family cysteine protease